MAWSNTNSPVRDIGCRVWLTRPPTARLVAHVSGRNSAREDTIINCERQQRRMTPRVRAGYLSMELAIINDRSMLVGVLERSRLGERGNTLKERMFRDYPVRVVSLSSLRGHNRELERFLKRGASTSSYVQAGGIQATVVLESPLHTSSQRPEMVEGSFPEQRV